MKVLYFGTVCDLPSYENALKHCKTRPTVATVIFESALLDGFHQNGLSMDVYSTPMIPNYRQSKLLYWGRKQESLNSGYSCTWLKTLNIAFLKQITRRLDARKVLKKWLKENRGQDTVVLSYGISPYFAKDILALCKKYGSKSCAIVADLPQNMFLNAAKNPLKSYLKNLYLKPTLQVQGNFDCYIYLTEAMAQVINPQKPYVVMEGILDASCLLELQTAKTATTRSVMYAGRLNEKYGIIHLIDAFEEAAVPDTELWLFGDGNAVDTIKDRAAKNPKIRFFGRVTRDEILQYEQKATLLVNPRSPKEAFTKYSFPSKTIEYMASGTPLLTTALGGIPEEYFRYVFSAEDNDVSILKLALQQALSLSDEELRAKGAAAKQFILDHKNAKAQSRRIIDFLEGIMEKK